MLHSSATVTGISIADIAKLAGTSAGTVDRALHGRKGVRAETRERILEIARSVGYETNWAARALSKRRSNLRIGVCLPLEFHPFYDRIRDGVFDEAKRFKSLGVEIDYSPLQRLGRGEVEAVRQMIDRRVQAIIMTPGDPATVGPEINIAERRGVRVVCVASDASESERSTVVCVQPEINGALAAELLAKFTGLGPRVAIVAGILRTDDQQEKVRAFSKAYPGWCSGGQVVEVVEGHDDEEETFHLCMRLLERQLSLDGIYVANSMGVPVCRALRERGKLGCTKLVTTDLLPTMARFFASGAISASVYQRPYMQGQTAVRLITDHLMSGAAMPKSRYLNAAIILCSNLQMFAEMRGTRTPATAAGSKAGLAPMAADAAPG